MQIAADVMPSARRRPAPASSLDGALLAQTLLKHGIEFRTLAPVRDSGALACVTAERELVAALGASCHTPLGAHARANGDGTLELTAWVGLPDGSEWLTDRRSGRSAGLGREVAERMLAAGAGELLRRAAESLAA